MVKSKKSSIRKKTTPLRKSLELLIKKVEILENQGFGQQMLIDELESKLSKVEEALKQLQDPWNTPFPVTYPLAPAAPYQPYVPPTPPPTPQIHSYHVCVGGQPDWTGAVYCSACGRHMSGPSWIITSTSDKTSLCLADPLAQSSSDVEPILDLDISWVVPDDLAKKD